MAANTYMARKTIPHGQPLVTSLGAYPHAEVFSTILQSSAETGDRA